MTTAPHQPPLVSEKVLHEQALHDPLFKEQGNNTPLELAISNQIDRFGLLIDVIDRGYSVGSRASQIKERIKDEIEKHRSYPYTEGMDSTEINNWHWKFGYGSSNI